MSALTRTILVLFNGPPVCGIFQLSHGFQEGIGNAVCHVTARVTLGAHNQFVHLLDAESHPSLVDVEVQNLFAGIAKAAEFETCGPPCEMIKARLMHTCASCAFIPVWQGYKDPSLESPQKCSVQIPRAVSRTEQKKFPCVCGVVHPFHLMVGGGGGGGERGRR